MSGTVAPRGWLPWLGSWWLGACLIAQAPQQPLQLELLPQQATVYVEQPLRVVLRVVCDTAFFRDQAVPLLAQPLDLPFVVRAPWLATTEAHRVQFEPVPGPTARRGAVGASAVQFRELPATGGTTSYELAFTWTPLAAGAVAEGPAEARYAFATRFSDDFLIGRQPVDRSERAVTGPTPSWRVRELPTDGRPADFCGAVGQFELVARPDRVRVAVGDSVLVTLQVTGVGNLASFAVPPPPELAGFSVQGIVERPAGGARVFVYDVLALRAGLVQLPPVPLVVFDPVAERYTTVHSAALPVEVVPAADLTALPPRVQALIAREAERHRNAGALPGWVWLAVAAGLAGAGLSVFAFGRRRARRTAQEVACRRLLDVPPGSAQERLAQFEVLCALLAGHQRCGDETWRVLEGRDAAAAAAARALHGQLADACYGGAAPAADELRATSERLLATLR